MAAITTGFEANAADRTVAAASASVAGDAQHVVHGTAGLGAASEDNLRIAAGALDATHVALVNFQLVRYAVHMEMASRTIRLDWDPSDGYVIRIDPPLPPDVVPWSRASTAMSRTSLLTYTSKMRTPSFSLPSGPPKAGGACPGAVGGQTITGSTQYNKHRKFLLNVLKEHPVRELPVVDYQPTDAVCQHCYASAGSRYAMTAGVVSGFARLAWTKYALSVPTSSPFGLDGGPSNLFVDTLVDAIARDPFKSLESEPEPFRSMGVRFFRLHDSGDFFSREYFLAWKAIADAFSRDNPFGLPTVIFWAPTRMWSVPGWVEFIDEMNGGSRNRGNFVIRPSAYSLNTPGPNLYRPGGGWAAHTTVYAKSVIPFGQETGAFKLNCGAYDAVSDSGAEGPKEITCQGARSPLPGYSVGCRACWLMPDTSVNYKHH